MSEINIPEVELIDRNKLIVDNTNPNVMDDRSYKALKDVIVKYGFIVPIITNKELKIADGYHRWKAARELNIEKIPVIRLDVDEVDRRMLRQIMNKLKGEHKTELDYADFKFLDDAGAIVELINLLPKEHNTIKEILQKVSEDDAFNKIPDGEKGDYEQITFTLHKDQAFYVKEMLLKMQKTEGFDAIENINENKNGNAVWLIVKEWEKQRIS